MNIRCTELPVRPLAGVPMRGLFISATDTGAGKTFVASAIVRALRRQGRAVRVCKPVATGAAFDGTQWIADDTRQLAEANGESNFAAVTPLVFPEPAAPPVAARAAGATLHLGSLVDAVRCRYEPGTMLVVEGVGGLLCPLTDTETIADLVATLNLPLVIVARRSLGTLNHTLLTIEVALNRGLRVAGVIVNETTPPQGLAEETNVAELRCRLRVPFLTVVPYGRVAATAAIETINWWQLAHDSE